MNGLWIFAGGLFVGSIAGMLLMSMLAAAKLSDMMRVIQMVGKYVADPSHENWYHLGAAYAQWLEEA